jgi:hypothetical protein
MNSKDDKLIIDADGHIDLFSDVPTVPAPLFTDSGRSGYEGLDDADLIEVADVEIPPENWSGYEGLDDADLIESWKKRNNWPEDAA